MRRFLIAAVALLVAALGGWYAVYHYGFYLDLHPDAPVTALFRSEGTQLLRRTEDGGWVPFAIRGVDVSASLPGRYATEFAAEEADYLRWFEAIGAMGANTLRAYTVMDDDFYNALHAYNTAHPEPLYLLQGIQVSDAANDGKADAYGDDFLGALLRDGRNVVDIIHGRKSISANSLQGSGLYRRDLSPWTVGYLVGQTWNSETIAYTDHSAIRPTSFAGTYFTTAPEATAFEALLARVMDETTAYESAKYKTQRLIAFINDPANDPFAYEPHYGAQLSKYAQLDAEHILPTPALASGYFAAYRVYGFCPDFSQYLSAAQQAALGDLLTGLDTSAPYGGYLELLSAYHTMPVVCAGYGVSSARGAVSLGQPPLTERQQGEALVAVYEAVMDSGWSGMCISDWQDAWERRTWNTAFATVLSRNYLWHDLQTDGQNSGLMAFDPGREERVCVLDGDPGEWAPGDAVLTAGGLTLSARSDAEGLYLLIQGEGVGPETPLYLPIDLTRESGSALCADPALTFGRAADFLLCLDGRENSRLLVQERYDAMRENFLFEVAGENPFVTYPAADSPVFVPVSMALRNAALIDADAILTAEEAQRIRALGVWETGRLTHGCGDPEAADYNSLADFRYGSGCVEVRLPWLLLNVADPSRMQIHSDYYEHYGVKTHTAQDCWIGLSAGDGEIPMEPLPLKGWGDRPVWHERLKQSYYIVQTAWKEASGSEH